MSVKNFCNETLSKTNFPLGRIKVHLILSYLICHDFTEHLECIFLCFCFLPLFIDILKKYFVFLVLESSSHSDALLPVIRVLAIKLNGSANPQCIFSEILKDNP